MSEEREMNVRIAREVMGLEIGERENGSLIAYSISLGGDESSPYPEYDVNPLPSYTTDDAAALAALDRLCLSWWDLSVDNVGLYRLVFPGVEEFNFEKEEDYVMLLDKSRPLAICRAIIAFLDWKMEQDQPAAPDGGKEKETTHLKRCENAACTERDKWKWLCDELAEAVVRNRKDDIDAIIAEINALKEGE